MTPTSQTPRPITDGWFTLGTGEQVLIAGPFWRLVANLGDFFVVGFSCSLVWWALEITLQLPRNVVWPSLLLTLPVVGCAYEVVSIANWGQTWFKKLFMIRVVRASDGQVPGLRTALVRFAVGWGSVPILHQLVAPVVCAPVIWDRAQRGLHDRAAGTIVVPVLGPDEPPIEDIDPYNYSNFFDTHARSADSHAVAGTTLGFAGLITPFFGLPAALAGLAMSIQALKWLPERRDRYAVWNRARWAKWGLGVSIAATASQAMWWAFVAMGVTKLIQT